MLRHLNSERCFYASLLCRGTLFRALAKGWFWVLPVMILRSLGQKLPGRLAVRRLGGRLDCWGELGINSSSLLDFKWLVIPDNYLTNQWTYLILRCEGYMGWPSGLPITLTLIDVEWCNIYILISLWWYSLNVKYTFVSCGGAFSATCNATTEELITQLWNRYYYFVWKKFGS